MGWITSWMEWNVVGAKLIPALTIPQRFIVAGAAPWFYAMKLISPWNLIFIYPRWELDAHHVWQFAYLLAAIAVVVVLWLARTRIGRGPLVAVLFFLGTLVPALGFVPVFPMRYSFVADHFQYLACIGIIALLVVGFHRQLRSRTAMQVVAGAVIVILGGLTFRRAAVFANLEPLWRDTIARNPGAWMARNNYGSLLLSERRFDEAAEQFRQTLALKPDHADAMLNLGLLTEQAGDTSRAEELYRDALRVSRPDSLSAATAHVRLGLLYGSQNRLPEAAAELEKAVALSPRSADWISELGMVYFREGNMDKAIDCFDRMLTIDPKSVAAHINMGYAMLQIGRSRDALSHWSVAIAQQPNNYRIANSMGSAYLRLGRRDMAAAMFRRALSINPDYEPAKKNLAAIGE
jgi:tetratricopeptide (TPR) repeat protein